MKKSLLFLGLLGLATGAHAQVTTLGPWVEVNTVNFATFAPGYIVQDIKTVTPNVAWAVTEEDSQAGQPTTFIKTNNAAGDQFDFGAISAAGASANFQTGNISSVDPAGLVAVAATYPYTAGAAGGEILRTTNGGVSWTKVTTASQFVPGQGGFCNFVHMFDANEGVALGDPTNGSFEILRTTDGGVTWTRVPAANVPAPLPAEFGLARAFFARGNTIWAGMGSSVDTNPVRIFKSTDKGVTWTASAATTLLGSTYRLAFRDDQNGIAYNRKVNAAGTAYSEVNVIRTADGGATWTPIAPVNAATGSFFTNDVDGVNGRFYSVGSRFPSAAPFQAVDLGSSFSTDGVNWTQISSSRGFTTLDVIAGTATNISGYAGFITDPVGAGGIYKASNVVVTANRDAALQSVLSAYPNPSQSGVFKVELGSLLKGNAHLTVVDALGRQVYAQPLNATAIGSKTVNLDLSNEKAGVYTMQVRTEAGIATQKLVIE